MMVQAELTNIGPSSIQVSRKLYSHDEVNEMVKLWSTGQVSIMGMAIGSPINHREEQWIRAAIFDALNYPEKFNCKNDNFGALMVLRDLIKNKNAKVLGEWYKLPVKLEYRNNYGVNAIVDVNHDDEVIFNLVAFEVLDVIADLIKNRSVEDIFSNYDFYHDDVDVEDLRKFKEAYMSGALNKLIKYICRKSNELGGFKDYGVNVIRNRVTSQFILDQRRGRGVKSE